MKKQYIYLVISPITGNIFGCFNSKLKASKYVNDEAFIIKKIEVI